MMRTVSDTLDADALGRAVTEPRVGGSIPSHDAADADSEGEDARALLARRVAMFGFGGAALSGSFLAYRILNNLITDHEGTGNHTTWIDLAHGGSVAFYIAMALFARSPRFAKHLRVIEAIGLVGASTCLILMSSFIHLWIQPRLIALLAMAISLFLRSAFVPSSGTCTAVLGAVLAVPLVATTFVRGLSFDPMVYRVLDPRLADKTPVSFALGSSVDTFAWWVLVVAASTAASRVIYGLRKEVHSARKLGRYHLLERLGAGGMGIVYRARHAMLDRPVAVKVLPPERLTDDGRRRFSREVQLTSRLRHPSTISVFDYGRTADGLFYYAMEYVEGATLAEVVAVSGAQPSSRVVAVLRAISGALCEAHGMGLVHRDLKPANVMVHLPHRFGGVCEVAKVLDFGLVKDMQETRDVARTRPGTLRGTPQYLAPESIKNPDDVGPASDLYALGAVGYFLLCGVPVFDGETIVEVCAQHLRDEPVPPSRRLGLPVDPALEQLLLDCLAKRPEDRPADALALEARLAALGSDRWSEADAEAWWNEHGDAIARLRASGRAAVSESLDPLRGSSRPRTAGTGAGELRGSPGGR